jgi:hypothetical protein
MNNFGRQPWSHPSNPLAFQGPSDPYWPAGPGQTFAGNNALKEFHNQYTFVPYKTPSPICDFIANIDHNSGTQCNGILPYSTSGSWVKK